MRNSESRAHGAPKSMERHGSVVARNYRIVDPFRIQRDEKTHLKPTFVSNAIRTSKYTYINFLPLCLFQEFRRAANMYFLIIAVLQSIPLISPLTPITAIAPLVMVISVSFLREALEDSRRRASDRIVNARPVKVVRNFVELTITWESIQVGDIIQVTDKGLIPADGVILSTSEDDGSCFIDTSNLDGEANLKTRESLAATRKFAFGPSEREKVQYFVKCEEPDQDLYRFAGNLSIDGQMHSLSEKQFVLRGSTLMNTKWATLLIVYTGHETKLMKNARPSHHKLSRVEVLTSKTVVVVFGLQMTLCVTAAVFYSLLYDTLDSRSHLFGIVNGRTLDSVLVFLSFVVLMNTLIPISLVVTVEIVKTVHARFISWDAGMRNAHGHGAIANTSSLTDELGQVQYIFTDKTGTLTMNQMVFRKCSVGGHTYCTPDKRDSATTTATATLLSIAALDLSDSRSAALSSASKLLQYDGSAGSVFSEPRTICSFRSFLRNLEVSESRLALAMALCHTVVCEQDTDKGTVDYNADSPDECALVRGAEAMGVKLLGRNGAQVVVSVTEETRDRSHLKTTTYTLSFEVLRVLHFSSDRKRMSVIVRDELGRVKLLCKGADSVILDRCDSFLSSCAETMAHVDQFAGEGFRILLFAERLLDERYFESWQARYHDAELDMHAKEEKTEELMDELERRLVLIGASAVEDKLQEGVPETISLFQKAGIKIWVLTGDKLETALEMGKLCRVVTSGMKEVILSASGREQMATTLDKALGDTQGNQAIVIDGQALTLALLPANRARFLQLALRSATVLVCRTSPIQKAMVVELVKAGVPCVTLAVGDGANDVSMIRAAHVGVGVMGQEGMQAVRSADYAVQQFSHLGRLLLHHGRLSYLRTSQCINYFFYKNVLFTLPQFIYGTASLFSAQTFYSDMYITAYNVVFTAAPVLVRAIVEVDLPETVSTKFPELYRTGSLDEYLSRRTLSKALGLAALHALILTLLPMALYRSDMWSASVASFIWVVVVAHLQIFFETWNWPRLVSVTYSASLAVAVVLVTVYDRFTGSIQGVWAAVTSEPRFWFGIVLAVAACLTPWVARKCWEENFSTSNPVHILRRVRFFNKILDAPPLRSSPSATITGLRKAEPTAIRTSNTSR